MDIMRLYMLHTCTVSQAGTVKHFTDSMLTHIVCCPPTNSITCDSACQCGKQHPLILCNLSTHCFCIMVIWSCCQSGDPNTTAVSLLLVSSLDSMNSNLVKPHRMLRKQVALSQNPLCKISTLSDLPARKCCFGSSMVQILLRCVQATATLQVCDHHSGRT